MTKRQRQYSETERTDAIALVAELGLAAAWRETGIPKPTLVRWCQEVGVERFRPERTRAAVEALEASSALRRRELQAMLLEKAVDLIERMDEPHVEFKGKDADQVTYPIAPANAVQNYATSAAILIDKYRLEVGEATGRTESLTGDLNNDHKRKLLDALVRVRQELDAERSAHAGSGSETGDTVEQPSAGESTAT